MELHFCQKFNILHDLDWLNSLLTNVHSENSPFITVTQLAYGKSSHNMKYSNVNLVCYHIDNNCYIVNYVPKILVYHRLILYTVYKDAIINSFYVTAIFTANKKCQWNQDFHYFLQVQPFNPFHRTIIFPLSKKNG